jgi:hypothetical protein
MRFFIFEKFQMLLDGIVRCVLDVLDELDAVRCTLDAVLDALDELDAS